MAKINFQQFKMPTGINNTNYTIGDARESVANMIYRNVNGIRAHALALKIYKSDGPADYSPEEVRTLTEVANVYGTPAFIDGFNMQLIDGNNQE